MAVEFFSYGYDTAPGAGVGELTWQEMHPQIGLATYGVRSAADWKVTAVSGQDRTVSIAAGRGYGLGVIDKTVANETLQLGTIGSGSRWDLIATRRDPTPTAGVSSFVVIAGGANPVIPGARLSGPGIHDQPLALVQVTAGQTQPTGFIDLRTWAGDGGGLVANHDLVLSFLNQVGTRINILGVEWIRRLGANDIPEWFCPDEPTVYAPVTAVGWAITGAITSEPAGSKRKITVDITAKRTGAAFTLDSGPEWELVGTVIPTAVQAPLPVKYPPIVITGGGNHILAAAALNPAGSLTIRSVSGSYPFTTNAQFTINETYYI
jgi:hypothetical protein